jgi:RNA polymerase sigma factor (sigma-70 family)
MSGLTDVDERAVVYAVQSGDEPTFTALVDRHRQELQVHCYRMLGSLVESEDLVQETFLHAWSKRETFEGRSTFRAWLYRIATNACWDVLDQRRRRVLPHDVNHYVERRDSHRSSQVLTNIISSMIWSCNGRLAERRAFSSAIFAA